MSDIKHLTKEDFIECTLNVKGFAIVECYNGMPGHLQIMEPIFVKLRNKYQKNLTHFRINTEENPFIIEDFYVINEPSYLIFYNGEFIDRIDGMIPFNAFANILEKYVNQTKLDDHKAA